MHSSPLRRVAKALAPPRCPLFTVAHLASAAFPLFGATYYVSPSGSDTFAGTFSSPFRSVQHAVETAQPGDSIHIRGGTYRESLVFGNGTGNSGAPGNEIVVASYPDERAIISAFDVLEPGQNGAGTWSQHSADIWKIQVPPAWLLGPGRNLVRRNGVVLQEARWPNAPDAFNFDYREMAFSEDGEVVPGSAGTQEPYDGSGFVTATYLDSELPLVPDGTWAGALIDLNPDGGNKHGTGVVLGNLGATVTFRYKLSELFTVAGAEPYYLWNHLAALDREDEAFLDVDGVSGPPGTLYLWSPEGDPSLHHTIEIRTRLEAIRMETASHLRFERLECLGGVIDCRPASSFVTFDRITAKYGGDGLNQLFSPTKIVSLEGTSLALQDSLVGWTFGGGVKVGGAGTVVENNVIRRCQEYGVATWGGFDLTVDRNTIAESGASNIAAFAPASRFRHNHCYLAGLRATDIASINTNGADVDMLGTEIAHNRVHANLSRVDAVKGLSGGKGIRLDSGGGGVYNMLVHHNIVWNINGAESLLLWTLPATSAGFGNSRIRAYNNTADGEIKFQGAGSMAGHDIRNNIARKLVLVGTGKESATVTHNLLSNQGFDAPDWPGNLFAPPLFVSGATANFYPRADSQAIDAGTPVAPVTNGFSGSAPDVGALEFVGPGARVWSAGALLLPEDVPHLSIEIAVTDSGTREMHVTNIPEGRLLPDGFTLRLGNVITDRVSHDYSIVNHRATGIVAFPGEPPEEGPQPVAVSLDFGATWSPMGSANVPPPGVSIDVGSLIVSASAGGAIATLGVSGLLSKERLIPVEFLRTLPDDLTSNPVPLVVDSRSLIAAGEVSPDGSNIRFRSADRSVELDYWIESGLNGSSTLYWLRHKPGESPGPEQIYLAVEPPGQPPVSDRAVVTSRYQVLDDPAFAIWYSANALAGGLGPGAPVSALPDLGPRGFDATQGNPSAQPHWNENRVAGLPTVSFDGDDFLYSGHVSGVADEKVSYVVVHRNELLADDTSRLLSSGTLIEYFFATAGPSEDEFVSTGYRRSTLSLPDFTIGRRSGRDSKHFTGEIAEILAFDRDLDSGSTGPWERLKQYASRKYALANEARGVLRPEDTIHPAALFVAGQEASGFTILTDGSVQFTIPPALPGTNLPHCVPIEIVSGPEVFTLRHALAYFEPHYHTWAAPLAARGLDDPGLDIEGDGIGNLLECALDLDPEQPDAAPLTVQPGPAPDEDGVLHLVFRRSTSATDVLLLLESTRDFDTWTTRTMEELAPELLDADPDGDDSARLYRAELPMGDGADQFYRLKAQLLSP